ncbi:fungal specific transcription factor [Purpureocillium lavendulum]|uniref:Fungal specific transcription factor n=1 Tax=Purpureocillium lavendulum TaxID=1247861 RepID=A0AB34FU64_9HYPO|nr:fungal specific transcription factor [Purpureocillium lavendulum]
MPNSGSSLGASVPRRRNGRQQACEPCHRRKVACDHALPNESPVIKSSPRARQAIPSPASPSPTSFTPQSDGTQGFLGATSFSAVLQEAQSSLTSAPGEPMGPTDAHGEPGSRLSLDDRSYDTALRVLRGIPSEETCRVLLKRNVNPNEGWSRTATGWLLDSLWTTFGPLLREGTPKALTQMALKLTHNSFRPLREDYTDAREWFASFSGPSMRWECIGILFTSWALGAKASQQSPFGEDDMSGDDTKRLLCKYKDYGWGCLEITRNMASANTLMQHLICRQAIVESIVTGDNSPQHWRLHGESTSMATFLGLHASPGDPRDRTICTQIKRRLFAKVLISDKIMSTFTGRPPHLARRFLSTPLPLDIPDDVLLGLTPWSEDMVDENGWNTRNQMYATTLQRARAMIGLVRDSILDIALQATDHGSTEILLDLKEQEMQLMRQLPSSIIFRQEDVASQEVDGPTLCGKLLVQLEHLQNLFFIERLLDRPSSRPSLPLLDVSLELVSLTLIFWTHKDRMSGLHGDFEWLVIGYAAPAGGVLCLDLLRGSGASMSRRSSVIQQLSLLVGFLDWVSPAAPNGDLCSDVKKVVRHVLDQTLNSPGPDKADGVDSMGYLADMNDFFNFELLDTFDWLRPDASEREAGAPSSIYRDFVAKEDEKRKSQPAKASTAATAQHHVGLAHPAAMTPDSQAQACDRCHRRKTKCDKGRPECGPCKKARSSCVYADRASQPLYSRGLIQRLERRIRHLEAANRALRTASPARGPGPDEEAVQGPAGSDALAQEVSFLSTSAGGDRLFLGPTSGILFASLVKAGVLEGDSGAAATPSRLDPFGPGAEDCVDDSLPPEQLARGLVDAYLAHDHLAYPFLHPGAIRAAVDCTYSGGTARTHAFDSFMFNMILAIASTQASKLNWQAFPDANTHHQRAAKYLNAVLCGGGLRALQAMLLLCQFQLTSSTRDASASLWHIVGISARMCFELGLHREAMYRVAPHGSAETADFEGSNVRRTCFWCVFALDREDVDVEMPSLSLGEASPSAPPDAAQDPNVPSSRLALFKHIIRYRDICGQCLTVLHRGGRDATTEPDKARIRKQLAEELQLWRADTNSLNLFEMDLSTPLAEARSSFRCKAWYELLYHNGVLLLYRPSYSTASESDDANLHVFSSAKESITLYSYLFRSRKINFSWMVLHAVFLAGLSYIYALSRHFRERRQSGRHRLTPEPSLVEIVNDCRACSNVLVAVSERCNSQKNCHEVFDRLSDAVVKDAVDALSVQPRPTTGSAGATASTSATHDQTSGPDFAAAAGSADNVLRDCFPELQSMYDAQWGDDAIMQLSTDWFNETFAGDGSYGWSMES